jgi:hypothetical protein
MRIFYYLLLGIFLCLFAVPSHAQYSRIEISIYRFWSNADNEFGDGDIEHTWKLFFKDNIMTNYGPERCHSKNTGHNNTNIYHEVYDTYTARYYSGAPPETFSFHLRGYEDDAGDRCEENGRDEQKESSFLDINLNEFAPGVWSQMFDFGSGRYHVYFQLRYTPVAPTVSSILPTPGNICADEQVTLTAAMAIENINGLSYNWQYHIEGDETSNPDYYTCTGQCYDEFYSCLSNGGGYSFCDQNRQNCIDNCGYSYPPTLPNWNTLGTSPTPTFPITPTSTIFQSWGISGNTNVQFRVQAVGPETYSAYGTPSAIRSFSPPAPSSSSAIQKQPSCPTTGTGSVTLENIVSPLGVYRYILKVGDVAALGCNPEVINNCLSAGDISGRETDNKLEITGIPVGSYSLFLVNDAGTAGVCSRRIGGLITIEATPNLVAPLDPLVQITCNGANNGSISLTISGGKPANVDYNLTNSTTGDYYTQTTTTANASVAFSGLKPGSHSLTVTDGCTPPVTQTFTITQPVKVNHSQAEFESVNSTCNAPGNGVAKITVSKTGTPDVSASTTYHYQLYKDNILYNEVELTAVTHTWTGLPPSTDYTILVKEKGASDCNGTTVDFDIQGPDALGVNTLELSHVTCNSGDNGTITVTGNGGTGAYSYHLEKTTGGILSNTTGIFSNLLAGDYTLLVKNADATCNDQSAPTLVTILQPSLITAVLTKTNISCYGLVDGKITSTVGGGTPGPGYTYTWETNINGTWTSLSFTGTVLVRGEGDYRLRIKDNNTCQVISNIVTIVEPPPVTIESVVINDIKCIDEKGSLEITSEGGVQPHAYHYSLNGGAFTAFTQATPLAAGNYVVVVKDSNNCAFQHNGTHTLTAPPTALAFTHTLSDFNGFNISCFGGSNGSATLVSSGGNGFDYSGYQYAVDARAFQDDPKLEGINAGIHSLKVKDGRGCIVAQDVLFNQTAAKLVSHLVEKKDVTCFGDETGVFEVTGSGGLLPFSYSLNGLPKQDNGRFTNLKMGDYTITLIDKNNCSADFIETVRSINPPMHLSLTPTDVNCFEGNDGVITMVLTGGVAPFRYQWQGLPATTANVNGLTKGNYTVKVTDDAGCTMEATTAVSQPEKALELKLALVPVCYRRTDGKITVIPNGGTAPYQFSIDNGLSYQSSPFFPTVGLGDYTVKTKDANNCITSALASIVQRNDRPEPNFLAASKRNALDTLIITDISVPKPDSIIWEFDANAIVLNDDQWSPLLKFKEPGTYSVSMTGFFGACEYTVVKNVFVSPFDPSPVPEKAPGYTPIESMSVTPNPSSGEFEVTVKLNKKRNLSIVVCDMLGVTHYTNSWESIDAVAQKVVLPNIASGVYLVRVITETDAKETRVVIKK